MFHLLLLLFFIAGSLVPYSNNCISIPQRIFLYLIKTNHQIGTPQFSPLILDLHCERKFGLRMGLTNFILTVAGVSAVVLLVRSDVRQSAAIFRRNVKHIKNWLEEESSSVSKNLPKGKQCQCWKREGERVSMEFLHTSKADEMGVRVFQDIMSSILINGLCKVGHIDVAKELFYKLFENGLKLYVYTYTIMINVFSKEGLSDEAYQLFRSMGDHDCLPNNCCYNVMIQRLLRNSYTLEAAQLLAEIVVKVISESANYDQRLAAMDVAEAKRVDFYQHVVQIPFDMFSFILSSTHPISTQSYE